MIKLTVAGAPKGKGRPRFVKATGHTYTPIDTEHAEHRIQQEWITAGRPTLDGPLGLAVHLVLQRPKSHYRRDGTLSAAGERSPRPIRKPDVDNALKLVADALNGLAYRDDAQIVYASVQRDWAQQGDLDHTRITLRVLA
jgi:Holliday junction resolvase RusA-like endonuclease